MKGIPPGLRWPLQIALYLFLALYWSGAMEHSRLVNTDRDATDQSAYMNYARKMHDSGYAHVGDRNRMPVYPFLLSLNYEPSFDDERFFELAKTFNIVLSMAILAALWWILGIYLPAPHVVTLLGILAFTLFLFKAPYVQCEVLYYFLIFCTFLLMCRMLVKPGWTLAAATGVTAALAHLTKASALPGVAIFLVVAGGTTLAGMAWPKLAADPETPRATGLLQVGLAALVFLAVIFPYISTSKRVFGRWFYNVNSTFYMWYDTREQVFNGTRAHGDREGWPRMPPEEIPGIGRYLREHSAGEVWERLRDGFRITHKNFATSFGFYKYLLAYAALALMVVVFNARTAAMVARQCPFLVLFVSCWFVGYGLLYAWIAPVNPGPRLPMQQVLTLMFTLACVAFDGRFDRPVVMRRGMRLQVRDLVNVGFLAALLIEIWFIRSDRILTQYAGG